MSFALGPADKFEAQGTGSNGLPHVQCSVVLQAVFHVQGCTNLLVPY